MGAKNKLTRHAGFLLGFLASACTFVRPGGTGESSKATQIATEYVSRIVELWRADRYWLGDRYWLRDFLARDHYKEGTAAGMMVFWHEPIIGFCSPELNLCVAYIIGVKGHLMEIEQVRPKLKNGSLVSVTRSFISGLPLYQFLDHPDASKILEVIPPAKLNEARKRETRKPDEPGLRLPLPQEGKPPLPPPPPQPGTGVPSPPPPAGAAIPEGFQYAELRFKLPSLRALPPPKRRPDPSDLTQLISVIKKRGEAGQAARTKRCYPARVFLPYYSERDPVVLAYVREATCSETVIDIVRDFDGNWRFSGWTETPETVARIRKRVRAATLTTFEMSAP